MFTIVTVCNCGVATSAFSRSLVIQFLEEQNYVLSDFKIENTEIVGVKGMPVDVIVTQKLLAPRMPQPDGGRLKAVIALKSLIKDKEGLSEQLLPVLERAEAEGLIHKNA